MAVFPPKGASPPLLLLGLLLLLALLVVPACADDVVQVHSLVPPMLQHYWANGMAYWSFGRESVVTDNYVRLTSHRPKSMGYLWNRHENMMTAFQLNVTLQMTTKSGRWGGDTANAGMGIWYTNAEKTNYHSDAAFFGFQRKFGGVGVILNHKEGLSIVLNDGKMELTPSNLAKNRVAHCTVPRFGELHLTVSLLYQDESLEVHYTVHPGAEPKAKDLAVSKLCATLATVKLPGVFHFGVTAANSAAARATHDVHSIIMTPLSDTALHEAEEHDGDVPRLFETVQAVEVEAPNAEEEEE